MCWMVGYKKNNTEFETVIENNYCTHNPLNPHMHIKYKNLDFKGLKMLLRAIHPEQHF